VANIVIFGATGYAGQPILDELVDRGHSVTAVARDVSGLPDRPGLTARAGSVHDDAFTGPLLEAVRPDVIIVSVPAEPEGAPHLAELMTPMLAAASRTGARLGVVGGSGSLQVTEGGPIVLDTPEWPAEYLSVAQAHARALAVLRADGGTADWFYVSPPMVFGSFAPGVRTGKYRLGQDVVIRDATGASTISAPDLAVAFADEIERPAHHRTRFTVGY
jgi:putative NADH-flavin reductase